MLQGEHSAILSTCIKLPFVIKISVLSSFEWPLKTCLTVPNSLASSYDKSDFLLCFSITERAVEPLKAQLGEVDQAIKDQLDLIGAVKSNIIRNDMKIEKMLRTIAKS